MQGSSQTPQVAVTERGSIRSEETAHARIRLQHILDHVHLPVHGAAAILTHTSDPSVRLGARAEAAIDLEGTSIQAHAAGDTMVAAVDQLQARLWESLVQYDGRDRTKHCWIAVSTANAWRHDNRPSRRDARVHRPSTDRRILRRKAIRLESMTPDEAAFEMDLLGHDFFLFLDAESGYPSVVSRDDHGRFLISGNGVPGSLPTLTEDEARARALRTGEPVVCFRDPVDRRCQVLYTRYDGHYGLVSPR